MSYEVSNDNGSLGQFASGYGYSQLIDSAKQYPNLNKFFETGETAKPADCARELLQLAKATKDKDIADTARGLAQMIYNQKQATITDGVE